MSSDDPTMDGDDDRLADLLLAWEESIADDKELSASELCPDDPQLALQLARKIQILKEIDNALDATAIVTDTSWGRPVIACDTPPTAPPGYQIISEIGRGGMGIVYKAMQSRLDRLVALKVILNRGEASPRQRERFEAEARAVAKLKHENIVRIYDIIEAHGCSFIAMEFINGCDLAAKRRRVAITPEDAAELVEKLAFAIQFAHEQGIVHRDLKPANILLEGPVDKPLSECVPKITDFGIAYAGEDSTPVSTTSAGRGSPAYMAPEQARADSKRAMQPTVDIHGLGTILYELLTGRRPYEGDDSFEILKQVVEQSPPSITALAPNVPKGLADICTRCLAKDPAARFPSAEALGAALREYFAGTYTVPQPPRNIGRRVFFTVAGASVATALGYGAYRTIARDFTPAPILPTGEPIKIGLLFSRRGPNQTAEMPLGEAVRLAAEEINEAGGVMNRPLEIVWRDPRSRTQSYIEIAEQLIAQDKVAAVIGCFRSTDRRAVTPVFERHKHLLIYPVVFEGLEETNHVLYTGSLPNQRLLPAIQWCRSFLPAKKFFLMGTDSLWSRAMSSIARPEIDLLGAEITGDEFIGDEGAGVEQSLAKIDAARPEIIVTTLGGESLVRYIRAGRSHDADFFRTPHLLLLHEPFEAREINFDVPGERFYFCTNYLFNLNLPANRDFQTLVHQHLGKHRFASDGMESAYVGLKLWSQAAVEAQSIDTEEVIRHLGRASIDAPSGRLRVDLSTLALWQYARIGHIVPGQGVVIDYDKPDPIAPIMYPASRPREEWNRLIEEWKKSE